MKECPKCKAQVADTAKFCIKCGFNIKKHEEENSKVFCPECGTEFSGGRFCPECGYDISLDTNPEIKPKKESEPEVKAPKKKKAKVDVNLDSFEFDIDNVSSALERQFNDNKLKEQLMLFEYSEYKTGGYVIKKFTDAIETNVIVPNGVVAINDGAFENSLVISVNLPDGLKLIGKRAFANSKYLRKINIPLTVNRIEAEAFAGCESLDINIPNTVSIKGKDLMVNTLTEAKALKKAEEERLAKIKAEEERKNKAFKEAKNKVINEVKEKAKKENVKINLSLDLIENAINENSLKEAKDYVIRQINQEVKRIADAKMLAIEKESIIKELTALANKKGVPFASSYTKDINAAVSHNEVIKKRDAITVDINNIEKERIAKQMATELEKAKKDAINEVTKYASSNGIEYSSSYSKTINGVTKINDISKKIADVKKKIDQEKEKKRLAKVEAERKALELKKIDEEVEEIKKAYETYFSEPTIKNKDFIDFGLYPQTEKIPSVKIIKEEGYYAYGDDGRIYHKRYFYNSNTKQYDILKYHQFQFIRWRILKETRNNYLLISEYVLSAVSFNDTNEDKSGYPANDYEHSSVRSFCNDAFINKAFNAAGKAKIEDTEVENGKKSTGLVQGYFSKNTVDKVFLISYKEAEKYFKNLSVAKYTSQYAREYLGQGSKLATWWTRSPGVYCNSLRKGAIVIDHHDGFAKGKSVTDVYGFVPMIVLKKK